MEELEGRCCKGSKEGGSNPLSSKEVTMATEPQPTTKRYTPRKQVLGERRACGPEAMGPTYSQKCPKHQYPATPAVKGVEQQASKDQTKQPRSMRQERSYLCKSRHRSPNEELVCIAFPMAHGLNKMIWDTHTCGNSSGTNPKAVTGK